MSMLKHLLIILLVAHQFSFATAFHNDKSCCSKKCTGAEYCSACKNCSGCAHCNSGGYCGVCRPEAYKKVTVKPKTQTKSTTAKPKQQVKKKK